MKLIYDKPFLTPALQIEILISHGLLVTDKEKAIRWLRRIGYYRLTGYLYPFRVADGAFLESAAIEHALSLYVFDKKFRLLVLDAIERIEVAVRVEIALLLGARDPLAHLNSQLLDGNFSKKLSPDSDKTKHQLWLKKFDYAVALTREDFIPHFLEQFGKHMPIWVAIEVWDFGMLSRFFSGMQKADQKCIAQLFGVNNERTFVNWLAHINLLRNIAAHHGRLWNRKMELRPSFKGVETLTRLHCWMKDETAITSVAASIAILDHLVSVIQPDSEWSNRMINFLKDFPDVPNISVADMGFDPSFIFPQAKL